jgi:hypothetical protein
MAIFSDVGIAFKSSVALPSFIEGFLDDADAKYKQDEGTLYVFADVKWYEGGNEEVQEFIKFLETLPSEDYRLVEACSQYPGSGSDRGEWLDNPWRLRIRVSESLSFS